MASNMGYEINSSYLECYEYPKVARMAEERWMVHAWWLGRVVTP